MTTDHDDPAAREPAVTEPALRVLLVGDVPGGETAASTDLPGDAHSAVDCTRCAVDAVWAHLSEHAVDVLVVPGDWEGWARCASEVAVVVVVAEPLMAADATRCFQAGAQDVVTQGECRDAAWPRRLRAAFERQRVRTATRQSFATDTRTGLPHVGQLIEQMSHLLALREREPAPMALLALRIEGLSSTALRLGNEAASALRRRIAVRLRAGVRASDVVATIGDDSFAVLLSQIDAPGDADRVLRKLTESISGTFHLAGRDVAVAVASGIAAYPADGTQPDMLLRRAAGLAASAMAVGRAGHTNWRESGSSAAANDDAAS
jgi:diguanylate cyclase (GGDEF)-like protein